MMAQASGVGDRIGEYVSTQDIEAMAGNQVRDIERRMYSDYFGGAIGTYVLPDAIFHTDDDDVYFSWTVECRGVDARWMYVGSLAE